MRATQSTKFRCSEPNPTGKLRAWARTKPAEEATPGTSQLPWLRGLRLPRGRTGQLQFAHRQAGQAPEAGGSAQALTFRDWPLECQLAC